MTTRIAEIYSHLLSRVETAAVKPAKKPITCWGIMTDDGLDGIEHTERHARKEAKDIREMGLNVTILMVNGVLAEQALDACHELIRDGKALGPKRIAEVASKFGVTITKSKG